MLVDEAVYADGRRHGGHDTRGSGGFAWVGLHDATEPELSALQAEFGLDELAVEDALSTHQRAKLDQFRDHSFLVMKTITRNEGDGDLSVGDVCIFFSDTAVITVRHGEAMPLATIRRDLEARPDRLSKGSTTVVHEIVDRLVDQYLSVANGLLDDVSEIEDSVFDDEVPAPAAQIYAIKRKLIEFRRSTLPLLDPLTRLASGNVRYVAPGFELLFSDVKDHLLRVMDEIDSMDRIVDSAMQANLGLIGVKQNEDMRKISAWVGIAAVPTMIAGIYGMNFDNMPELHRDYGYFIVIGFMATVSAVLFRLFRRFDWL